jgi:hypothetical protein
MEPTKQMPRDLAIFTREIIAAALTAGILTETDAESAAAVELAEYYARYLSPEDVEHAQQTAHFIAYQLQEAKRLGWVEGWPAMTQSKPPMGEEGTR